MGCIGRGDVYTYMKASNYESRSEDDGSTSAIHGRAVFRQFYLR